MGDSNGDLEYDLVTIGAGSGGVRASRVSAGSYGAKVRGEGVAGGQSVPLWAGDREASCRPARHLS